MVHKIHKTKDYTVMPNFHLRDKNMTLKTKGLLSIMLALPESWDYSINGLCSIVKDGRTAVRSALIELEELHYLTRTPLRRDGKIYDWQYDIYEQPQDGEPHDEKLDAQNRHVENSLQLNTKESITDEINTKRKKESKQSSFDAIIAAYTEKETTRALLGDWLKVRKAKRAAMTDRAIQLNLAKLDEFAKQSGMTVDAYLTEVIRKGWQAFYPIGHNQYGGGRNAQPVSERRYDEETDEFGIVL